MSERSKYQEGIIRNYYARQDEILVNRLSELVSQLYLSEGKSRAGQWKRAADAMRKLEVPESRIEHLLAQDNPELLAKLVSELLSQEKKAPGKRPPA